MIFGSVCSGIEAASVASAPLGWKAAFFSEIEKFPSQVLEHRNKGVPNLGDMTKFEEWEINDGIKLLCGGTPCQSFSVAGLRKGLDDSRGNLMLTFGEMAAKLRPQWLFWENVPGVLSSSAGRDFGAFLGLISGREVSPPKDGWGKAGVVQGYGNAYGIAYRIFDAQYFGVAQRRRRVFVVGHAGDWHRAAAVLLEPESLRGDSAPRRETGQGTARGVEIGPSGGSFTDLNPTLDARAKDGPIRNQLAGCAMVPEVVGALTDGAHNGGGLNGQDAYSGRIFAVAGHREPGDVGEVGEGNERPGGRRGSESRAGTNRGRLRCRSHPARRWLRERGRNGAGDAVGAGGI